MTVGKFVGSLVLGRRFPYPKPRRKNGLVFGQSITCHVFDSLHQWVEAHEFFVITCMEFLGLGTTYYLSPGGGGGKGGMRRNSWTPPPSSSCLPSTTKSQCHDLIPIPLSPHTDRLKIYYSVVKQIHESALCSKRGGFKRYLPQNSKHDGS